jgi:HD superfamily phosphohydrolase
MDAAGTYEMGWGPGDEYVAFADRMYGTLAMRGLLARVCSHPLFERLSRLRQVGTVHLVADVSHTRRTHSLQVGMLCHRAAGVCGLDEKARAAICLAGLLHDVGHGPYSHFFDDVVVPGLRDVFEDVAVHEERSVLMAAKILEDCGVARDDPLIQVVQDLISGEAGAYAKRTGELEREVAPLGWIVCDRRCGNDLDRLSYLLLDSNHPLVPQPPVDCRWLLRAIDHIRIVIVGPPPPSKEEGRRLAMFREEDRAGIAALQAFRTTMHAALYKKDLVVATEAALRDCLILWVRSGLVSMLIRDKAQTNALDFMLGMDDGLVAEIADGSILERFISENEGGREGNIRDAELAHALACEILERREKLLQTSSPSPRGSSTGSTGGLREQLSLSWYEFLRDENISEDGTISIFPAVTRMADEERIVRMDCRTMSSTASSQVRSSRALAWTHGRVGEIVACEREPFPSRPESQILKVVERPTCVAIAFM